MSSPSQTPSAPAAPKVTVEALEIKAELLVGAAILTAAVISKMPVQPAADPSIKDATLQNLNLTAAALVKVYYAFLDAATNNQGVDPDGTINGWAFPVMPAPSAPIGGQGPAAGSAVTPLSLANALVTVGAPALAGVDPAVIAKLQALLAAVGGASSAPATPAPAQVLSGS